MSNYLCAWLDIPCWELALIFWIFQIQFLLAPVNVADYVLDTP